MLIGSAMMSYKSLRLRLVGTSRVLSEYQGHPSTIDNIQKFIDKYLQSLVLINVGDLVCYRQENHKIMTNRIRGIYYLGYLDDIGYISQKTKTSKLS